ncbi:PspC domain-containing protein [Candidatus Saccharibacteria bacterium]|nr:PspC domain-containing protein [Candidatus Saccharibacteria bacterium]
MKETTRIHIAKTSYDIEIAAKKELEKYIGVLEAYAEDSELLNDIEIRITELLGERNVEPNGVITSDDVKAVRTQLGEPEEFMDNGDIAIGTDTKLSSNPTRKLYRNVDGAIFGGVLSGIAHFFGINPLWTRLIFIVLLLLTAFMPMALIYVILWVVVPPARTAAEKLQMSGKPVTLAQIRELNESEASIQESGQANTAQKVILSILGVCSAIASIGTLLFTAFAGIMLGFHGRSIFPQADVPIDYGPEWPYYVAYGLAVASGVLLAALFGVVAYALMARKFTKQLVITTIVIIAAGLTSFAVAAGIVSYRERYMSAEVDRVMQTKTVVLPESFKSVSSLKTTFNSADVHYVVDANPRIVVKAVKNTVSPKMEINGTQATLSFTGKDYGNFSKAYTRITVYGPRLATIVADRTQFNYKGGSDTLTLDATNGAAVTVEDGEYLSVLARTAGSSSIMANDASVERATIIAKGAAQYSFGVVKTLDVTAPEVCAAQENGLQSWGTFVVVASNVMTYNGAQRTAVKGTQIDQPCAQVKIGQEPDYGVGQYNG